MKTIELWRHTSNEGDALSVEGVAAAVGIGRELHGGYDIAVSSGAQRATQTLACLIAGRGERVPGGVVVVEALRSTVEDRWREAYRSSGSGTLESLRDADPDLVATDSAVLADGLRAIFALIPEGGRALAVGHSPTNEAAIYGLTGVIVAPMGKGEAISIAEAGVAFLIDDR